jgi:hypothetical protein
MSGQAPLRRGPCARAAMSSPRARPVSLRSDTLSWPVPLSMFRRWFARSSIEAHERRELPRALSHGDG